MWSIDVEADVFVKAGKTIKSTEKMIYNVSCFGWKHFLPERTSDGLQARLVENEGRKEVVKRFEQVVKLYCTFYGNVCGFCN